MSRTSRRLTTIAVAAAAVAAGPVVLATDYCEMGDAGNDPGTAQTASGGAGQTLSGIQGTLAGTAAPGEGDFQDMYIIRIVEPTVFQATTIGPGSAEFDSQLFLFRFSGPPQEVGLGLLGNDDVAGEPQGTGNSRLLPMSNDGSGITITVPGLYLVAISAKNDRPLSLSGEIFAIVDPFEISGPDGPGGGDPVVDWTFNGTGVGAYRIDLVGCQFVAAVPTLGEWGMIAMAAVLLGAGALALRRRGRALA